MDEYIERESILNAIRKTSNLYIDQQGLYLSCELIAAMPAAEVQPVNKWISVKDRLPEPEKEVLIWYRYTWGAGFMAYRFGISKWFSNIKRWYEGCLSKDIEVLYWQPLPEPPKDGDTE